MNDTPRTFIGAPAVEPLKMPDPTSTSLALPLFDPKPLPHERSDQYWERIAKQIAVITERFNLLVTVSAAMNRNQAEMNNRLTLVESHEITAEMLERTADVLEAQTGKELAPVLPINRGIRITEAEVPKPKTLADYCRHAIPPQVYARLIDGHEFKICTDCQLPVMESNND